MKTKKKKKNRRSRAMKQALKGNWLLDREFKRVIGNG
jgi:hypothetical protein